MHYLGSWFHYTLQGFLLPWRAGLAHLALLGMLLRRELVTRTSGTLLGRLWPLLQPALQVLGFWFLFDIVYGMRMDRGSLFLEYLLVGMLPWLCLSEVMGRSAGMFREFSSLFRRSPFPVELLPLLIMLLPGLVYTLVYVLLCGVMFGPLAALRALPVIPLMLVWLLPFTLISGVLGLFIRDFAQALPFVLMLAMYTTPILYFPDMLPGWIQSLLWLNPFASLMAMIHALVQGMPITWPFVVAPLLLWGLALGPAWLLFRRSLPHIREVL